MLWILSDLHVELTRGWDLPPVDARPAFDVLVVAGDLIPRMERGVEWLRQRVTDKPVIYVAGNHEAYGCDIDRTVEKAKEAARGTNIFVLECDTTTIGGVTFAGATMWTDFNLFGDPYRAMDVAGTRMNDFRKIRISNYARRFLPHHALARHLRARAFFETELRKPRSGPMVVVSHHAPIPDPNFGAKQVALGDELSAEEVLSAIYRSDLTALMIPSTPGSGDTLRPVDLWIHGHTHESVDLTVGQTRVISNAKGYGPWMPREPFWENRTFDPLLTIDV
nr:metallophosphoesterase [Bradyrhizobium sp. Bra64]